MGFWKSLGDFFGGAARTAISNTAAPIPPQGFQRVDAREALEGLARDAATTFGAQALQQYLRHGIEKMGPPDKQLEIIEQIQQYLNEYAALLIAAEDAREARVAEAERLFEHGE